MESEGRALGERVTFLSWYREGWSAAALPPDPMGAGVASQVQLDVDLAMNASAVAVGTRLIGPGDVIGLDRREIIRTDPAPGTQGCEPNFLASIEFDRPDLPWLFTPASANANDRLRPWLVLVVVRAGEGVVIGTNRATGSATLRIESPAKPSAELPDLSLSWAWAHTQAALDDQPLAEAAAAHPERFKSRLICPRRLEPDTRYIACLVPAFRVGVRAGLGLPADPADATQLLPAWTSDDANLAAIELPVYHQWSFATGPSGDFVSLAQRIWRPMPAAATIGTAELDLRTCGGGVAARPTGDPEATTRFEGALVSPKASRDPFVEGPLATEIRSVLRAGAMTSIAGGADDDADPIVSPPVYGAAHLGRTDLPPRDAPPHWLRELNLDPRARAAAALGAHVVRSDQERLVAAAWDEAGDVLAANSRLRNAEALHVASGSILRRRLATLPSAQLFQLTGSVLGEIGDGQRSVERALVEGETPPSLQSPAIRRLVRPRGPLMRRSTAVAEARTVRPLVAKFVVGSVIMSFGTPRADMVTFEAVETRLRSGGPPPSARPTSFAELLQPAFANQPKRPTFGLRTPDPWLAAGATGSPAMGGAGIFGGDSFHANRLRAALAAHQPLLKGVRKPDRRPVMAAAAFDQLARVAVAQLAPAQTVSVRMSGFVRGEATRPDGVAPIRVSPVFSRPLSEALNELFPQFLLPGIGRSVEPESITLAVTNTRFVEAFLAGANHELGAELLWRGFPGDRRATPFRHFWNRRGGAAAGQADIPEMRAWPDGQRLGSIAQGGGQGGGEQIVLVLRGELVRRYPALAVSMVEAKRATPTASPTLGGAELAAAFSGLIGTDAMYFGFAMGLNAAIGTAAHPGWFFVLRQPATDARFGEEATEGTAPPAFVEPGATAAETAKRLLRRPLRLAVHARSVASSQTT